MKVIIQRSIWLRGTNSANSFLVRYSDEKMCCLGFLGLVCGIPKERLIGRCSPSDTKSWYSDKWPKGTLVPNGPSHLVSQSGLSNSQIIRTAMEHNDDSSITDEVREGLIKEDLAKLGVDVEFED